MIQELSIYIISYSFLTAFQILGFASLIRNLVQYIRRDHDDLRHLAGVSALFIFVFMLWILATGQLLFIYNAWMTSSEPKF